MLKICEKSYFSEKYWNARNYLFYNRKRGSEQLKNQEKSIQNRCKIKARKRDAERSQNKPKGSQNGCRNRSKMPKRSQRGAKGSPKRRKRPEKRHAKNEAEKRRKNGCQKVWHGGMRVATPKCHYGTSWPYAGLSWHVATYLDLSWRNFLNRRRWR